MDSQLLLFRRQYLQLFEPDFLAWPPQQLLRDAAMQEWIYDTMFNGNKEIMLPPERYQLRVLKPLIGKIESSIVDAQEEQVSDNLMSHLANIISSDLPSEDAAVQQKSYVTFSCIPQNADERDNYRTEPSITLLERRHLISGSRTTGFRTWEAALHLGSFLLSSAGSGIVSGKNVLELGAGTGFISMLCAKHLNANHVISTDGDEGVVEALRENFFLNRLEDVGKIDANVLKWGFGVNGTWLDDELQNRPLDIVLGADITYDKAAISALVTTLRSLFKLRPELRVLISGAVRNTETFDHFRLTCSRSNFELNEIDFRPRSIREQEALFYATAVPLKIMSIQSSASGQQVHP